MEIINQFVLSRIPGNTKRLLDIGCGSGWLGREIKQKNDCYVVGITISEEEAALASQRLDRVIRCDLNNFDPSELGKFDCIVCSHILEHLYQPQDFLRRLRNNLIPEGVLIVALPNILIWKLRWEFLRGRFRYTDSWLMDKGHLRFFDWQTAHAFLEENGYKIIKSGADGNFPLPVIRRFLPSGISSRIDHAALKYFPGLFGFQFVFTASLAPLN